MRKCFSLLEKCPYSKFFWSVFCAFGLSPNARKIQTWKTPNRDTFPAVFGILYWEVTIDISIEYDSREENQVLRSMLVINVLLSFFMVRRSATKGSVWSDSSYFVSGEKLNLNFIGVKIRQSRHHVTTRDYSGSKNFIWRVGEEERGDNVTSRQNRFTSSPPVLDNH